MTKVNFRDAWVSWVMGDWRTELNYVYAKSTEGMINNNNKIIPPNITRSWRINGIKTGRRMLRCGNVGEGDERQTRFRLGVAYSF